jgi:hypothetical protein
MGSQGAAGKGLTTREGQFVRTSISEPGFRPAAHPPAPTRRRAGLIAAFLAAFSIAALLLFAASLPAASAATTPAPAWTIASPSWPTNFIPGESSPNEAFSLYAYNSGDAPTDGSPITITDQLPTGFTLHAATIPAGCSGTTLVTCTFTATLAPGQSRTLNLFVDVEPTAPESGVNTVSISGGGAPPASTSQPVTISSSEVPFGFLPSPGGVNVQYAAADGSFPNQAGSHPSQVTVAMNFSPTPRFHSENVSTHVRDIIANLPPGMIVNPNATELCSMHQLEREACPAASAIGLITIFVDFSGNTKDSTSTLYNMEPPPGAPSEFAFNALGLGPLPVTLIGSVRSGGDYGLTSTTSAILAKLAVVGVYTTLWGDPSEHAPGAVPPASTPFLTMPEACSGPLTASVDIDSWEQPGALFTDGLPDLSDPAWKTDSSLSHDQGGNPLGVEGCNRLGAMFEPTIEARPTTDVADSPSGLSVDLKVPQHEDPEGLSTPDLRDAVLKLPEGLVVNPSSADGLQGCSEAQIALNSPVPAACPDPSKIGTVEVHTQLVGHPLPGAVYLAQPTQNPFGSLLALYIAIHDPLTGVVVKLPAKVEANPQTGQLQATVTENPQLPFEDFRLEFFEGARAPLRTPATCGSFESTATLTPYSAPESGPPATPSDSFQVSSAPAAGTCPHSAAEEPDDPAFEAGTTTLTAGAFSPFVLHLKRKDDSQGLRALDVTLPPGLSGRLAGVGECSDAQIAQAQSRAGLGEGRLERESPSCPLNSELGAVNVGAGAGPTPIYTQGHAYLAGPYKGAPLSMVIITPAIAGPFDLGAVVVRSALYVNPETAQITVKSDPIPQILYGIPLDVRSIAVQIDRNQFTLNPTNCDPLSITAEALSPLGQSAPLSNHFQVAECAKLAFGPKLALSLKGATKRNRNPALKAVLSAKPGEANIASAQVTLPHSEFLDQAHIKTICTRVQFAEGAAPGEKCPAASIYGHARAVTPLLEKPLEGPVYLRSSSHNLPDLVAALNGQIEVELDGRIDTGKGGGIRNTFEAVPDAPVSKFTLEMAGGSKGLLVNSENICRKVQKATVKFTAHNGKVDNFKPTIANSCKAKHKRHGSHH